MKRISSEYAFSLKMFPYMFFGFLGFFFFLLLVNGALQKNPALLLVPCGMTVLGYFYMKTSLSGLADEVYDCGDFLLVKKRGEEEQVPLSNIINVNFSAGKPERITLTLAAPGKFGQEISFAPPPQIYFSAVPKNAIAQDLLVRADKARSAHAG